MITFDKSKILIDNVQVIPPPTEDELKAELIRLMTPLCHGNPILEVMMLRDIMAGRYIIQDGYAYIGNIEDIAPRVYTLEGYEDDTGHKTS